MTEATIGSPRDDRVGTQALELGRQALGDLIQQATIGEEIAELGIGKTEQDWRRCAERRGGERASSARTLTSASDAVLGSGPGPFAPNPMPPSVTTMMWTVTPSRA